MKIKLIVGVSVAILLLGSLTVPVIMDYVDGTKEAYKNSGAYGAAPVGTVEVSITMADDNSVSYTAGEYGLAVPSGIRVLLMGENYSVYRYYNNGILVSGVNSSGTPFYLLSKVVNATMVDNAVTLSYGASADALTTIELSNSWQVYRNSTGDYRIVDNVTADRTIYIKDISDIRGSNTITSNTDVFYSFEGASAKIYGADTDSAVPTVAISDVMEGVKSFFFAVNNAGEGAYSFNATIDGEVTTIAPPLMVVPNIVYGQTDADATNSALLLSIPIMVIVALAAVMLSAFMRRY